MFTLLDFQKIAASNVLNAITLATKRVSLRSILLQSATASGKTVIAGDVVAQYLAQNTFHKVLVLLNRQVLVGQTYETFSEFGIKCSVLHDEIDRNKKGVKFPQGFKHRVVLTMPETFMNTRLGKNKITNDPHWIPTLILIDEAHKGTSENYQLIRDLYPDAVVVGLTATPHREQSEEGEHLIEWYGDNLICTVSIEELIALGRLVRPKYIELDINKHNVVQEWKRITAGYKNKSTIIFTSVTADSVARVEAFTQAGISCELVTAGSDVDKDNIIQSQSFATRQAIYSRFESGETQVLISVEALCEGFDVPRAQFCFLVRTVGTISLFHQMIGRVLRSYFGKDCGVVVDFCGNIKKHGPIEHYEWSIKAGKQKTANVRGKDSITWGLFKDNVICFGVCVRCQHVYDVKKHRRCTYVGCNEPNTLKVVDKAGEIVNDVLGINSSDFDKKFVPTFRTLFTGNDTYKDFARKKLARDFGMEFDDDGGLPAKYAVIQMIVDKKISWAKEVHIELN